MKPRLTAVARPKAVFPVHREIERLLVLASTLEGHVPEAQGRFLARWRDKISKWMYSPRLESLEGERAVESLSLELRYLWLRHVHAQSDRLMMSPPHAQAKRLPSMSTFGFPYDRWLKPDELERRLLENAAAPSGWQKEAVVFSSGMAALTAVLHYHRAKAARDFPPKRDSMSVQWFGGYFEITRALELICDPAYRGHRHMDMEGFLGAVAQGHGDLLLIEPVAADLGLAVFDLDAFITAWRQRPQDRTTVILVDTSLVGDTFPMERLCRELGPHGPALVAEVRSGIKLDQQGLELANVGLLSLYAPEGARFGDGGKRDLPDIAKALRLARTTFGAGLSADEYAALTAPFFLDTESGAQYARRIFDNNARFAHAIAPYASGERGLIRAVLHPCLGENADKPWAVSPIVNIKYADVGEDENDEARDFFRDVLEAEARRRGLTFRSGSSFGFRAHRFEMGFVRGHKYDTLRIAIGARAGPSLDGTIQLFQELARYEGLGALRAAYADLVNSRKAP